jgi:Cu(I)/Ag(I) efflux system protein CusF
MNRTLFTLLLTTGLVLTAPAGAMENHAAHPAKAAVQIVQGQGIIKSMDQDSVVISHQPIKALGWPAMTMGFKVADRAQLKGLAVGNQVDFSLKDAATAPLITAIQKR